MRNVADGWMKKHLSVEVWTDQNAAGVFKKSHEQAIDDPFVNTTTVTHWSLLSWFLMLFRGRTHTVRFHIHGDSVAMKRWFAGQDGCDRCGQTIGFPHDGSSAADPGYHHGDERICEDCYYGREPAPKTNGHCYESAENA